MNNSMQFTDDERARLLAVWKHPSEKKLEALKSFIDSAEFILSDVLNNDFCQFLYGAIRKPIKPGQK